MAQVRSLKLLGSAALNLCAIAAGRCDAYYGASTPAVPWALGRSLLAPLVALLYDAIALPYARLPHSEALRAALCPARLGSATSAVVRPRFATPMRRETPTHSSRVTCVGTELGVVDMRLANWGAFTVPLARPKLLSTQS